MLAVLVVASAQSDAQQADEFNDSHFHLRNYIQRGFGTDLVAPTDPKPYFAMFDLYAPLWSALTPEASEKVRKGNYTRLFDAARKKVHAWEASHVARAR